MPDQLRPADPRVIGPYRLTGRLGSGGMGDVFLGRSAGGRLVAVKVIRAELAQDPEFRTRFRNEVDAARRVNGLYTAPVADADVDGAVPWLATASVAGPSLDATPDFMSPEQALGRDIGPASDMFSLGGVLIFAATGLPPFYGGRTTMVLERIVTQPPDLSRVPAELRPLIEWCLDKEPARRPAPRDLLGRLDDASLWDDWLPQPLLAGRFAVSPARTDGRMRL